MNVAETALPTRGHNRPRNPGATLAPDWFESVGVNASAVERRAATLTTRRSVKKEWQAAWLVKAMTCIDLTTLSGDDTPGRVRQLCAKASRPLTVAAVCVYPTMVGPAVKALKGSAIPGRLRRDRLSRRHTWLFDWTNSAASSPARENRLQREKTVSYATQLSRARDRFECRLSKVRSLGRFARRPSRGAPRESSVSDDGEDLVKGGRRPRRRSQDSDNIAR